MMGWGLKGGTWMAHGKHAPAALWPGTAARVGLHEKDQGAAPPIQAATTN